jgi:hypothetical protein
MKRVAVAFLGLAAGCGGLVANGVEDDASNESSSPPPISAGSAADASDAADGADGAVAPPIDAGSVPDGGDGANSVPNGCADASVPPTTLECAGLYADFASQTLSPTAQAYAPAVPLWSDSAAKERWIELPPGQKIDISDPSEWVFPVGTKVFKQFTYEGRRVETRLFQKIATGTWVHATYAWNADQTATSISYGETVPVDADGGTWVIPTPDDCDSCHRGRTDRILGFEQVSLGLAGATGLTLLQLVAQDLVAPLPTLVNLRIGDDGTGLVAPALSWLHINCGVTCHNSNENAQGYAAKMILRLDPTWLDGSPASSSWDPLRTTIGVPCVSGSVEGEPRILGGNPSASAIVQLISERGPLQMPPIASRVVDTADVAAVVNWISHMASAAGVQDGGIDGGSYGPEGGQVPEGGNEAGGSQDAGAIDATIPPDASDDGTVSDTQVAVDATPESDGGDDGVVEAQGATDDSGSE